MASVPGPARSRPPADRTRGQDGEAVVAAMRSPGFYPFATDAVETRETHLSWVFLAGARAYKVKKPLVLPFVDYGTLERRRILCHEEVRLNRRLAPRIYLGVRAIVRAGGGFRLAAPDDPRAVEYAVEMRRYAEVRTLEHALEHGRVGPRQIHALARRLARFHAAAPQAQGSGAVTALERWVHENFEALAQTTDVRTRRRIAAAERFAGAYLAVRRDVLAERQRRGRVRDGHGDLRAEHVLTGRPAVEVVDCIEFDDTLRAIDVGNDLAFLLMDLIAQGHERLADELVRAYRAAGGDPGDDSLLAFYAAYRALVRAKVARIRAAQTAGGLQHADLLREADSLLALAERLAWRSRFPIVLAVCGVSASGKTHLASVIAALSGMAHLSSDVVRKGLLGLAPTERANPPGYSGSWSRRTYGRLGRLAARETAAGRGVLVDATFRRREDRDAFRAGLGAARAPVLFVECQSPTAVLLERAERRLGGPGVTSDATPALAARQAREWEPLDEVDPDAHVVLRSDRSADAITDDLLALLDERLRAGRWAAAAAPDIGIGRHAGP